MTRLLPVLVAGAAVIELSVASAQTTRPEAPKGLSMTGIAKSVSQSSLTLNVDGNEVTFALDKSTQVYSRRATGPHDLVLRTPDPRRQLTYFVKEGDPVAVVYRQVGSTLTLVQVRVLKK